MLFMIIERFHGGDPRPVYERFAANGRMAPEAVNYVNSWVTPDLTTCYQVMESPSRDMLDEWIANWSDIVDFEVIPVITSAAARQRVLG